MSEELVSNMVSKMRGHIIVMGYKFLGMYVVERLREMGLEFVVLVRDESQLPGLHKEGIPAMGSPIARSYQALVRAGADRASAIICTFDDDGDNLLTILNAKKINPRIRAITIVNDDELYEAAVSSGADVVIAPYELAGQILAMSTVSRGVSAVFVKGNMKNRFVAELAVDNENVAIKFSELCKLASVIMVLDREGKLLPNPPDDYVVKTGDTIYVLTERGELLELEHRLAEKGVIKRGTPEG
ncbi:MAG: NAD-binding protein [Thermoprotei archaeon]